jgi:N6-adenosine-specific RNA methylase IME4/DNA-binding XRE family transcriptional regulator
MSKQILPHIRDEFRDLLPPLSGEEKEALRASIEREGVRDPIIVDEDGAILDGHNRYSIDASAPTRIVNGMTLPQKMAFIIAVNLQRRNLSPDQRSALRQRQQKIAMALKADGATQEDIATRLGIAQQTVSDWFKTNTGSGIGFDARIKIPKAEQIVIFDRVEAGESQEQVAADFGVTQMAVSKICRAERKRRDRAALLAQQAADIAAGKITAATGPFDVICIDPPWPYGTKYDPGERRAANPYPEMSLGELTLLDVAKRAAPDCVLWLWTTHKFMRHSFALLDAWGFEDAAICTWFKNRMGLGSRIRSQSEFVIMAIRGSPELTLTKQTTVFRGAMREHSRKPDEFFELVESLCAGSRRYDWFAREARDGWLVGGNDPGKFAA